MGDSSQTIVRLDSAVGATAEELAASVAEWLVRQGVIAVNPRRDPLGPPSEWVAGPQWREATDSSDDAWLELGDNGVDIPSALEAHHPIENLEPPACPMCGVTLTETLYESLLDQWLVGGEPVVTCPECGAQTALGDWPAPWGYAVGSPAVRFHNWPPLSEEFLARLRAALGGRTFVVRSRW